jgi:pyruvate oxidase
MVYSDLSTAVAMLRDALGGNISIDHRSEVAERWRLWCEEKASRQQDDRGQGVASAAIFDCLSRLIPDDAIITVNVGNNTYSFGRYFECHQQAILMSGASGARNQTTLSDVLACLPM